MRKVAFLALPALETGILEVCSSLTPLVEPDTGGVFLDLNGCGPLEELLEQISMGVAAAGLKQAALGLACSRLAAAMAALMVSREAACQAVALSCQVRRFRYLVAVEVQSGQDAVFLGHFRVEDFPLLKKTEARRLKRGGFRFVNELQDMSGGQIGILLGRRDVFNLEQGLKGRDGALVLGTYPPERLFYRGVFEPEIRGIKELEEHIAAAAGLLGRSMEERHVTAGHLLLRLHTGAGALETARILQSGCGETGRLYKLLKGLLARNELQSYISGLDICLGSLGAVGLEQPGLFAGTGPFEGSWRERMLEDGLERLLERFPEAIGWGLEADWREKVLSFWDPWRFGSEQP